MKNELATKNENVAPETLERVLLGGDISSLKPDQKVAYYKSVCESVGLNPLTKPFDFIKLNGKEVMYVKREATEQLRKLYKVSITISSREVLGDAYVVTAKARINDREDESTGVVTIKNLSGESLSNAYMKAETKAKRRVTLSICGLGLLDETEIEDAAPDEKKAARIQDVLEKEVTLKVAEAAINPSIVMPNDYKPGDVIPYIPANGKPMVAVNEDADPVEPFESFGEPKQAEKAEGYFKIEVGKELYGKMLMECEKPYLEKWARSTKEWFVNQKIKISPKWQETFENIGQYLGKDI